MELMGSLDPAQLLSGIVERALDLLECDAGSLFLVRDGLHLDFEVAFNRSVSFEFKKSRIPLSRRSIATEVFLTGESFCVPDVYKLTGARVNLFDKGFDKASGYRTRSMLALPLKTRKGEVLGVLQILNKKNDPTEPWPSQDEKAIAKMPAFTKDDVELMESFAAVAGISLENARLYGQIEQLFESFVRASVVAIDARDPGTKGHSDRVATLTVGLARAIAECQDEDLKDIAFSEAELRELLFAGYLHDFGKLAVRESTLQKEQKLSLVQRERMKFRMEGYVTSGELAAWRMLAERLHAEGRAPNDIDLQRVTSEARELRRELDEVWERLIVLSRPSVLDEDASRKLQELRQKSYRNERGELEVLLGAEELAALSIRRGCLTDEERLEIESHVTQSYLFLRQIPWDASLAQIPEIAYGHHELLDGSGYPRKLKGEEIPLRSRIMTICDIFDALSASDRAYKAALPIEKSLSILEGMVAQGKLDPRFYRVFKEKRVWEIHDYRNPAVMPATRRVA
jgi:HD-GYP domain-containing protein (c-di-GMP phosphodiesterase class II)